MKKFISFLIFSVFILEVNGSNYPNSIPGLRADEIFLPVGNTGKLISLQELSVIKPREFETLTGQKLRVAEKIMFKFSQKQLRNHIHKDGTLDRRFEKSLTTQFNNQPIVKKRWINWFGLSLGLFLSAVGLLIAYLWKKSNNRVSLITWAWIGFLISTLIWGLTLL